VSQKERKRTACVGGFLFSGMTVLVRRNFYPVSARYNAKSVTT
jgi:hypothetical protein